MLLTEKESCFNLCMNLRYQTPNLALFMAFNHKAEFSVGFASWSCFSAVKVCFEAKKSQRPDGGDLTDYVNV